MFDSSVFSQVASTGNNANANKWVIFSIIVCYYSDNGFLQISFYHKSW